MEKDIEILEEFLNAARFEDNKGNPTDDFYYEEIYVEKSVYKAIERIIKRYKELSTKNLDAIEYVKKWIDIAEKDWCGDIMDYNGISGLYKVLKILESEENKWI